MPSERISPVFWVGVAILASSWADLHWGMLTNRGVGNDIKALIETRTSDRWTRSEHEAWANDVETRRNVVTDRLSKRLDALEKK